jgi:tetratricopeptide (TPR) repeat protein
MKKQIIALSLAFMSLGLFAQKNELKAAGKFIKKQDFAGAVVAITAAEALLGNMDAKLKAKFYFLKAQAFAGQKKYSVAADTFSALFALEEESGKQKYTSKAKLMQSQLVKEVADKALKLYNDVKDYKNAAELFYLTYKLSPTDTSFMYNAAVSARQAKETDAALDYYMKLKAVGYTGILTEYFATNKDTGKEEKIATKNQRDLYVKSGQYNNPVDKGSNSKKATIQKSIALILKDQGKIEEALAAMEEAKKGSPKDFDLIMAYAFMYNDLKQMGKFGALIEEAIELEPENPTLYFNLGVASGTQNLNEDAIKYYKKAIEINPNYRDAFLNIAYTISNARTAVVDEMSENFNNEKKYLELEKKNIAICKEALPYLEKADALERTMDTVKLLMNLYDTLEMIEESDVLRPIYKQMREQK